MTAVQVTQEEQLVLDAIAWARRELNVKEISDSSQLDANLVHQLLNQGRGLWEKHLVQRFNRKGVYYWSLFDAPVPSEQRVHEPVPRQPMPDPSVDEKDVPPAESPEDKAEKKRAKTRAYNRKWYADHREKVLAKDAQRYALKNASKKKPSKTPPVKDAGLGLAAQVADELSREIHAEALKEAEKIIAEALVIVRQIGASK